MVAGSRLRVHRPAAMLDVIIWGLAASLVSTGYACKIGHSTWSLNVAGPSDRQLVRPSTASATVLATPKVKRAHAAAMSEKQDTMKISWIGNSFIYYNDLPEMVSSMLTVSRTSFPSVLHRKVAPGGQRFAGHANDSRVAELLQRQPPWDVVVLQDNSGVPGGADPAALTESHYALREVLAPLLPSTATILVYCTWGHCKGSVYSAQRHAYPDYLTMQRRTTEGTEGYVKTLASVRDDDGATGPVMFVPVGDAFCEIHREDTASGCDPLHPASFFARLFLPDEFHPSRLGSYLAACVFTHTLLDAMREGAFPTSWRPAAECALDERLREEFGSGWEPAHMSEEDAARLQRAAWRAVQGRRRTDRGEE